MGAAASNQQPHASAACPASETAAASAARTALAPFHAVQRALAQRPAGSTAAPPPTCCPAWPSAALPCAAAYYLVYNAAIVCILPWLAILWHELGFSGGQLGILSGLRPFIAALSGERASPP